MEVFTSALSNLGVIRVSGADARSFLHGQLTQDIMGLQETQCKLAGYCSAKGRLYAIMQVFAEGEVVFLLTHRALIEPLIKRLRMFVLRAQVLFEDISQTLHVQGVCTPNALASEHMLKVEDGYRLGVLPALVGGQMHARELRLSAQVEGTDAPQLWDWLDIKAGLAHIEPATYEAFVPQMVNLDRVGGVNFKKGCYPGQEVVARSHYLGKLKRRMQAARLEGELNVPEVGTDVFSSLDSSQPAGKIVSAVAFDGGVDVLYEISLPLLTDDAVLSCTNSSSAWQKVALPYSLSD